MLDLGGTAQTIANVALQTGTIQNGSLTATLNSIGGTVSANLVGTSSLTTSAGTTNLTGTGSNYSGATNVNGSSTLNLGAGVMLNAASATKVFGTLDLGAQTQTVNSVALQGGVIQNGSLIAGVTSQGGTIGSQLTGGTTLIANGGTTQLSNGTNNYTGATTVNAGATVLAAAANAFSKASATTVNTGGTLDLGALAQQINALSLNGGTLQNGPLSGAVTSQGGTIANVTGSAALTTASGVTTFTPASANAFGATTVNAGSTLDLNSAALTATSVVNNGTFRATSGTLTTGGGFTNAGVLDLRGTQPTGALTVASNTFNILGNYIGNAGSQVQIDVVNSNAANTNQQANILNVSGTATGASTLNLCVTTDCKAPVNLQEVFLRAPTTILTTGGGGFSFSSNVLVNGAAQSPNQLLSYVVVQQGNTYKLFDAVNGAAVGGIVGGIASAIGSAQAGFFQGSTAFIGSPPNQTPNFISSGVWTRDAAGMNMERSAVTSTFQSTPLVTQLSTISHFSGEQVGADFAINNMGGSGWNLHSGLTGGQYMSSASGNGDFSSFRVPFIGVYTALTGHGFNANLLVRHDSWYGNINSGALSLSNARMNGNGTAVTAEVGYTISFENGAFLKPTAGFSYNRASFESISGSAAAAGIPPYTLLVGPVVSELGVVSVQAGYRMSAGEWALVPNAVISAWHEFASAIPGRALTSNTVTGQPLDFALSTTRVGTFGQIGVGIAASPLKLPNLLMYVRADYRSGENLTGGTFTFGARYSF